jgi:hypothetical protein
MSLILDKNKFKKVTNLQQKSNILRNSLKNNKIAGKFSNKIESKQKPFITNKKERRHKSSDINHIIIKKNTGNHDSLLSNKNDPFSRSVIFSHNQNLAHKISSSIKNKKNNRKTFSNNINKNKFPNKNNSKFKLNSSNKRFNISEFKANTLNIDETQSKIARYESIENTIIDKNYENDIDHDEIIIGSNKNNENKGQVSNLYDVLHLSTEIKNEKKETSNKNEYNEDDYLIDNNFENNKNDFSIMYIDNYAKIINDDVLSMELQLLYEKILILQNSYHEEYIKIMNKFYENKKYISLNIFKYKEIQKKIFNLLKIREKLNGVNQLKSFLATQEKGNKACFKEINDKEIDLWENMLIGKGNNFEFKKYGDTDGNLKDIKEIFKKIVFDKYSSLKNSLNDIENKIVVNLMKKNNYKIMPNKKVKNHTHNRSYNKTNYSKFKNKYERITAIKPKKASNYKLYDFNYIFGNTNTKRTYSKNNKFHTYNINTSLIKKYY